MKTKPKKIVVEERNENNEIVRQIIEKAKKRKVTALKKAILKKREKEREKKEIIHRNSIMRKLTNMSSPRKVHADEDLSSGYETIDDNNDHVKIQVNQDEIVHTNDTTLI